MTFSTYCVKHRDKTQYRAENRKPKKHKLRPIEYSGRGPIQAQKPISADHKFDRAIDHNGPVTHLRLSHESSNSPVFSVPSGTLFLW